MNQELARKLRKAAKYNPADDPIKDRKYRVLVCNKVPYVNGKPQLTRRERCGQMVVCRDERMTYRNLKKRHKAGLL